MVLHRAAEVQLSLSTPIANEPGPGTAGLDETFGDDPRIESVYERIPFRFFRKITRRKADRAIIRSGGSHGRGGVGGISRRSIRRNITIVQRSLFTVREVGGGAGGIVHAKSKRPIGIEVFAEDMAQIFTFLIFFSF